MITVVIILFIAFSIFFPGFVYKSRWNDAYGFLLNKDTILTIDRLGRLYNYSFYASDLQRYIDSALPINKTNLIARSEVEGAVKAQLTIACNCTEDQISTLAEWFSGLRFNDREVTVFIPKSNLNVINEPADVLLIWGYKNLNPYAGNIRNFMAKENGVVEIMDFTDPSQINSDAAQQQIFNLRGNPTASSAQNSDSFTRKPTNSSDIFYSIYKYFYHIPAPIKTVPNITSSVPAEIPVVQCGNFTQGNITFNQTAYKFWDCFGGGVSSVYFDTNGNNLADTRILQGDAFNLTNSNTKYNFTMSYIYGLEKIGIGFRPNYVFNDFGNFGGASIANVQPLDANLDKVIMRSSPGNYPVVIINNASTVSRAAWIADFSENGHGADEKQLLMSAILWASNKRSIGILSPNVKVGFLTSYVNTANKDVFEVYKFNFGLGFPFGR